MKKFSVLLAVLVCCFALAACGMNSTATKNFSTIAEEFTEKMYRGDYEAAAAYISDEYADNLNADALKEIVEGTEKAYGAFCEISGVEQSDMDSFINTMTLQNYYPSNSEDFVVYYESIRFEKGEMGVYFLFDGNDRRICGITVCGTEALTGADSAPEAENSGNAGE